MTTLVRDAYDSNAELYASLFRDELDRDAQSLKWLAKFSELASQLRGPIADVGCGPGGVVHHLHELGLDVIGYDLSPGQIEQARNAYPDLRFGVGDLAALDVDDSSLGGIVSRYSLIHLAPSGLRDVFVDWIRALEPEAPVFVSFFGSRSAAAHGTSFDHKVVTAYELFPETVGQLLQAVGFTDLEIETTPIPDGGRPFDHTTMLVRKPAA